MLAPIAAPVASLVPHAGGMCLLDRVIDGDEEHLRAEVSIRSDNLFCDGDGVGAWLGMEFMAQAVAAWSGWRAMLNGIPPRIGFLLGTRLYNCSRDRFLCGELLLVEVRRRFQSDDGLGQFDCQILIGDERVASATLTVFEPADASKVLQGKAHE